MDYGTGAIFGCPAHDQRDLDFAKKYNLEITEVVSDNPSKSKNFDNLTEAYVGDGTIVNSDFLNGLTVDQAKTKIIKEIEKLKIGEKKITFRLKDWGISRQRYWGCPIPMLYREDGKIIPVSKKDLPITLPPIKGLAETVRWYQKNPPRMNAEFEEDLEANYKTEDALVKLDSSYRTQLSQVEYVARPYRHPYAHPKKPNEKWDHRKR